MTGCSGTDFNNKPTFGFQGKVAIKGSDAEDFRGRNIERGCDIREYFFGEIPVFFLYTVENRDQIIFIKRITFKYLIYFFKLPKV